MKEVWGKGELCVWEFSMLKGTEQKRKEANMGAWRGMVDNVGFIQS